MKNAEHWRPTKFIHSRAGLTASRNSANVAVSSRFIVQLVGQRYEAAIRAYARGRLLDMGCGHVPLYDTYRSLVTENICIDWANTLHVNPYLDQTLDLGAELPFDDASFDTVILTDVLEHLPEPMNVMTEIARLLRPGGKLILGVPFFYWLHEEPHDYYRYTKFALQRFCDMNRLRVIELTPYGGLPEVLMDMTGKSLEYLSPFFRAALRPIHGCASALCRLSLSRKLSVASREAFPLGYMLIAEKTDPSSLADSV